MLTIPLHDFSKHKMIACKSVRFQDEIYKFIIEGKWFNGKFVKSVLIILLQFAKIFKESSAMEIIFSFLIEFIVVIVFRGLEKIVLRTRSPG